METCKRSLLKGGTRRKETSSEKGAPYQRKKPPDGKEHERCLGKEDPLDVRGSTGDGDPGAGGSWRSVLFSISPKVKASNSLTFPGKCGGFSFAFPMEEGWSLPLPARWVVSRPLSGEGCGSSFPFPGWCVQ